MLLIISVISPSEKETRRQWYNDNKDPIKNIAPDGTVTDVTDSGRGGNKSNGRWPGLPAPTP